MQIVIDIPEVFYESLKETNEILGGQRSGKTLMSVIYNAVSKGTPLPKGMSKCRYNLSEDCRNTDCLNCVLDKIRAEIVENSIEDYVYHGCGSDELIIGTNDVLKIIDKYKAESEE